MGDFIYQPEQDAARAGEHREVRAEGAVRERSLVKLLLVQMPHLMQTEGEEDSGSGDEGLVSWSRKAGEP